MPIAIGAKGVAEASDHVGRCSADPDRGRKASPKRRPRWLAVAWRAPRQPPASHRPLALSAASPRNSVVGPAPAAGGHSAGDGRRSCQQAGATAVVTRSGEAKRSTRPRRRAEPQPVGRVDDRRRGGYRAPSVQSFSGPRAPVRRAPFRLPTSPSAATFLHRPRPGLRTPLSASSPDPAPAPTRPRPRRGSAPGASIRPSGSPNCPPAESFPTHATVESRPRPPTPGFPGPRSSDSHITPHFHSIS